jgi:histidyl-tRNA synthetase
MVQQSAQILKGFRDFLPQRMILRQRIIGVIREVFEEHGFEPFDTPSIEYAETLEGKFGEEEKLIYKFVDKGGRRVALRYDLTVPLARAVAMHRHELVFPFKRYQIAPVWRADRPQKGRYREFWQCDADVVGTHSMLADADCLMVTCRGLQRLGFDAFTVHLNNRKLLGALVEYAGAAPHQRSAVFRAVDSLPKVGIEAVREELREAHVEPQVVERVLELAAMAGDNRQKLELARERLAEYPQAQEGIRELWDILDHLEAAGFGDRWIRIDLALARGLDYYTGPIFETVVNEPRIGSITGGGRYDNLIGIFARQEIPAVGTSFGLERIIDVIEELGMWPDRGTVVEVLVTVFQEDLLAPSLSIAQQLRSSGIRSDLYYDYRSDIGKQLRYADRKGIPVAVIVGPDEVAKGEAIVKVMASGQQRHVPMAEVAPEVRRVLMEIGLSLQGHPLR